MKTQAITILAFAGAGLAQERSNVHIGTEVNFTTNNGGFQSNPEITINQCFNLPQEYWLALTAISPNSIIKCNAYSGPDCTGVTQTGGFIDREVGNLALPPWNFDNRAFSLNCTRR